MTKYIPFAVAFALFMETIDSTIINTAIPQIAHNLGTNPLSLKIALTSYLLSLAIFIPVSGWLSERFGSKRIFILAIVIFTLGSLGCSLAINLETLVLSRIIQGVGGAFMMPVGRLILLQSFPKTEIVSAMNYMSIPSQFGRALGPVLGGLIVSYVSWRWIFLINIPIGIAGLIFGLKVLPERIPDKTEKLDYIGFILFGLGLAASAFAIQSLGESMLDTSTLLILATVGAALILLYFIYAKNRQHPFIDLNIFKVPTFSITVLGNFISRCCSGGIPFLLPMLFQLGFGMSPIVSGFLLLPFAISVVIAKLFLKSGLKRFGFKKMLLVNTFLLGVSTLSFALMEPDTSIVTIIILTFLNGMFTSLQFSCLNVLSYLDLPKKLESKGTSIGSAVQMLSMSFGIAIAAMILEFLSKAGSDPFHIPIQIFQEAFLIVGILTILSTITFFFLKANAGAEASGHVKSSGVIQ